MVDESEPAELEVGLHRRDAKNWTVELRAHLPGDDEEQRWEFVTVAPDLHDLGQEVVDEESYGRRLTEAFFAAPEMRSVFAEARAAAGNREMRLRLYIGQSAPELHDYHWETLRDPDSGAPLLDERTYFSRFLSSDGWRPVTIAPKRQLRAVVLIANPTNLEEYRFDGRSLSAVDVGDELPRVQAALGPVKLRVLASGEEGGPRPTMKNLVEALRAGCDLLYIVCHGRLFDAQPWLLLEDDDGRLAKEKGADLVEALADLRGAVPRLVVLASCQSAGSGAGVPASGARAAPSERVSLPNDDHEAFTALGPRLAEARVPAVVAMQGNVSMETVADFMPAFFGHLHETGQVDLAMAAARAGVAHRPDWWMPVLFTRLKSGRLWYSPRFAEGFEQWKGLLAEIRRRRCIAILGPGLSDALLGSRAELAWRWANEYRFPMAPDARENLPQVAQYIAVNQKSRHHPHEELGDHLRRELLARYRTKLPDDATREAAGERDLEGLIGAMNDKLLEDEAEPHRLLAALPFPVYITTQQLGLLAPALRSAGRPPESDYCRWTDEVDWPPSVFETKPDYQPTAEQPLVFHLFGRLQEPESLVLTEDDFFDYLFRVSHDPTALPDRLMRQVCRSSLLFLGFQVDDWEFRVLHCLLMNQQSSALLKGHPHVAVQIAPDEGRLIDARRARRYLESYFDFGDARIGVYWGTVQEFIEELAHQWEAEKE